MGGTLLRWSATTVIVAAVGGCAGSPAVKEDRPSRQTARTAQPVVAQDRFEDALLPSSQQLIPITAPKSGPYSSLPAATVAAGVQQTPPGATVKPMNCALWAGPDGKQFGTAAASVVAFRKSGDTSPGGVQAWEELVTSAGQSRQAALGAGPQPGCRTVRVSHQGNTLTFEEKPPPLLGSGSRGAVLTPSSPNSRRTWVVTFVGNGYVGVVFMQGEVTKAQMDAFATAAYNKARQKLG